MAGETEGVKYPRGFWPTFALPGVIWLLVLFVLPFYAVMSLAMGRLDPIFFDPVPVWNPVDWDSLPLQEVATDLLGGPLQVVLVRTFLYVGLASFLCLLIGYPVAYYVSRHGGKRKTLLLVLIIAPFWISYLMRMLAWVNLLQDDGYVNRTLTFLNILDAPRSWLAGDSVTVILGLVYGYVPFLILPLFAALDRIDQSLLEGARDLGASPVRTFFHITLPLSRQGILGGLVLVLLPMFGDYYTPDLLSGASSTSMIGNQIDLFIHGGTGGREGAALVIALSAIVSVLMIYYLYTVARASREARA